MLKNFKRYQSELAAIAIITAAMISIATLNLLTKNINEKLIVIGSGLISEYTVWRTFLYIMFPLFEYETRYILANNTLYTYIEYVKENKIPTSGYPIGYNDYFATNCKFENSTIDIKQITESVYRIKFCIPPMLTTYSNFPVFRNEIISNSIEASKNYLPNAIKRVASIYAIKGNIQNLKIWTDGTRVWISADYIYSGKTLKRYVNNVSNVVYLPTAFEFTFLLLQLAFMDYLIKSSDAAISTFESLSHSDAKKIYEVIRNSIYQDYNNKSYGIIIYNKTYIPIYEFFNNFYDIPKYKEILESFRHDIIVILPNIKYDGRSILGVYWNDSAKKWMEYKVYKPNGVVSSRFYECVLDDKIETIDDINLFATTEYSNYLYINDITELPNECATPDSDYIHEFIIKDIKGYNITRISCIKKFLINVASCSIGYIVKQEEFDTIDKDCNINNYNDGFYRILCKYDRVYDESTKKYHCTVVYYQRAKYVQSPVATFTIEIPMPVNALKEDIENRGIIPSYSMRPVYTLPSSSPSPTEPPPTETPSPPVTPPPGFPGGPGRGGHIYPT